jgi:hypothetical protein
MFAAISVSFNFFPLNFILFTFSELPTIGFNLGYAKLAALMDPAEVSLGEFWQIEHRGEKLLKSN